MKKTNKKSSVELSFNFIFSVILIIVFIASAVYAINKFMNISQCSQVGIFKSDLQDEVDKAWGGTGESIYTKTLGIPSKITYICFADRNSSASGTYKAYFEDFKYSNPGSNFFFYPKKYACDFKILTIKHVDIKSTTDNGRMNPYCIPVNNGKVEIKINKGINDALVCIGDNC